MRGTERIQRLELQSQGIVIQGRCASVECGCYRGWTVSGEHSPIELRMSRAGTGRSERPNSVVHGVEGQVRRQ